jgi:hypothetical protein
VRKLVEGLGLEMDEMPEQGYQDGEDKRALGSAAAAEREAWSGTEASSDRRARELTESPLAEVTEAFVGLGRGWGSSRIVCTPLPHLHYVEPRWMCD